LVRSAQVGFTYLTNWATLRWEKYNADPLNKPSWRLQAEPVAYALFSAVFGTQAVVQAKCLALLLQAPGAFGDWLIWVTLLGWLFFVWIWLSRLNSALGRYNALFIIPMFQAAYIFLAIVNGGIFCQGE